MTLVWSTVPRTYRDSVALMALAAELQKQPAIGTAGAVMATPANAEILGRSGMWPEGLAPSPEDILVVAEATDPDATAEVQAAIDASVAALLGGGGGRGTTTAVRPQTLAEAFAVDPEANLVAISTPGPYAPYVARQALRAGKHVFCFSDNVSVAEEIALKDLALEHGLLFMGPDCGTASIDGVGLGFVNATRPGPIGLVAAAGTGAQEVMSLLDQAGVGVSQVIGLGGRDLSVEVGGRMAIHAVRLLGADPDIEAIVLVSKPPAQEVADRVHDALVATGKPAVLCLLGATDADPPGEPPVRGTLLGGAAAAARLLGAVIDESAPAPELPRVAGSVLGLYTGGSLASEAKVVLTRAGVPKDRMRVVDLGDDEYTVGRPHPMISPELRGEWISTLAPEVGVLLLDVVLGLGSHADPAGALVAPLATARANAAAAGHPLVVIASVTGTDGDSQNRVQQIATLAAAGVAVAPSNAVAAAWAASCLEGLA